MADIDRERLALLKARYGKPVKRSTVAVRSAGARIRARSKGLAAVTDKARRNRTLEASADGQSIRASFAGALKRARRT
jgi:hypothetical protein